MPEEISRIFRAKRVITMAQDAPEAFTALDGHIVATGCLQELLERFPGAEVIDFGDGVVIPGFNDAHMHLSLAAEDLLHLDLSIEAVKSLAEIKEKLRQEAGRTPRGSWIRGSRYDDAKMTEGRVLTRWDLDEVGRDHPVLVTHVAAHWAVVNSMALRLAGLDATTEPPSGGAFGHDASGRLNGILYEQAFFDFAYPATSKRGRAVVPESTVEDKLKGLARAVEMFHAAGLT